MAVGAALAFGASGAAAQELTSRFGIAAMAGGGVMAMDDANTQIGVANDFLDQKGWKNLGDLGLGFNFSGDLVARVTGPFWLGVGGGATFGQTNLDFDEVVRVRPSGAFYQARLLYDLPFKPRQRMFLRAAAGPVYMPEAKLLVEHEVRRVEGGTQRVEKVEFTGKGWGGHFLLQAEYLLTMKSTLVVDLGYRQLSVDRDDFNWSIAEVDLPERDDDGDGVPNGYDFDEANGIIANAFLEIQKGPDGRPLVTGADNRPVLEPRGLETIDFSGPILNVGLRFYIF